MLTIKIMITSKIAIMIKITSKAAQERNCTEFCKICASQASTTSKSSFVRLPQNLYSLGHPRADSCGMMQNLCSLGQHKPAQEQIHAECCKICAA